MENKGGKRLAPSGGAEKEPRTAPVSEPAPAEQPAPETASKPAAQPAAEAPAEAAPQKSKARKLWDDYGYMLVTLAVVFVVFKVLLQLAYVPSGSMETTIPTKTLLIGWRLPFVVSDPVPERGDIVTFWDEELNKVLVKRVIGLPGDEISFSGGYVYVNGEQLKEPYLMAQGVTECDETFTVPEGCFFPLGDNRTGSFDARFWETPYIPVSAIQAKPFVVISIGDSQSWQGIRLVRQGGKA